MIGSNMRFTKPHILCKKYFQKNPCKQFLYPQTLQSTLKQPSKNKILLVTIQKSEVGDYQTHLSSCIRYDIPPVDDVIQNTKSNFHFHNLSVVYFSQKICNNCYICQNSTSYSPQHRRFKSDAEQFQASQKNMEAQIALGNLGIVLTFSVS